MHTEAIFGVVFKERVAPSRAVAFLVRRIRRRRHGAAPNGGTAGSVGNHHAIAKELRDEACIRRFTAAGARTGELE